MENVAAMLQDQTQKIEDLNKRGEAFDLVFDPKEVLVDDHAEPEYLFDALKEFEDKVIEHENAEAVEEAEEGDFEELGDAIVL